MTPLTAQAELSFGSSCPSGWLREKDGALLAGVAEASPGFNDFPIGDEASAALRLGNDMRFFQMKRR